MSEFSWNTKSENSSSETSSDFSRQQQQHRNPSSLLCSFAYAGRPKEEEEDHDEDGQLKSQSRPMIPKRTLSPIPPDKGPSRQKEYNTEDAGSAPLERARSTSSNGRDIPTSHDTKSSSLQQVSSFDSTTKQCKKKKANADIRRRSDGCATDVITANHHTNQRNGRGRGKTLIGRLRKSLSRPNKKNCKVYKKEKQ